MEPGIYGPYRYLPITQRRHFSWPGEARLALWVIPNIEFFHLDDPMPGVNNERLSGSQVKTPNVRNWAIRDYGNRVGVWRFFEVLSRYGIRGTAALNSDICDYHPQIIETGVKLDWEFIGHCQTNARRLNELPPEQEKAAIHDTLERIGRATGRKPIGWLGAGLSETWNTLDYLIDEGVKYVADWACDDLPFRMSVSGRPIMSIPYSLQVNDTTQFYNQKATPEDFERMHQAAVRLPLRGERAGAARHGDCHPPVRFGRALLDRRDRQRTGLCLLALGGLARDRIGDRRALCASRCPMNDPEARAVARDGAEPGTAEPYSALTPTSLMSFAPLGVVVADQRRERSGRSPPTSTPWPANWLLMSGDARSLTSSVFSRVTISPGVPAGASTPYQVPAE